jgi:hypothetical protein
MIAFIFLFVVHRILKLILSIVYFKIAILLMYKKLQYVKNIYMQFLPSNPTTK